MEEGRVGRQRKFVTPWKKAAQVVDDCGREDRLERLAAAASSLTVLSPRVTLDGSNVQGRERGKKRKSPSMSMPFFRSPLSRMLLSPRIQLRSPSAQRRTSPYATTTHIIDLNVELDEENGDNCFDPEPAAQDGGERGLEPDPKQDGGERGLEPNPEPASQDGGERGLEPDPEPAAQVSARKKFVPNDKRRAIFDDLLVKAKNGNLKGHETALVSAKFSVPIKTVQRIWKQGKSCLDQGQPVDVRSGKSRCGQKKIEVDVSRLSGLLKTPTNLYTFNKIMLGLTLHRMTNCFVRLLSKMASTSNSFASQQIH